MSLLQPNVLLQGGKYKIVRFLSSGGFGNTYEGVHTMMDTRVAIKEFFPKMFCNREESTSHVTVATQGNRELVDKLRKKFNEEAKAVFKMNHSNIVRVLDIFEENGTAYYIMEYIDGKSLNQISKERGALPEAEAVGYIRQVADALKYVHSLNRLHLDIKPGNIMVDKNGKAILIDFGASKHYDDENGENTSTLMGVNTKGYAPIEQSTQSFTSFSPATDIYALGATLYKLLTGIVPPDANLLLAEEETLQPLPSSISVPTCDAVMTAMQFRRKNRPQSVDVFVAILDTKQSSTPENNKPCPSKGKEREADDECTIIKSLNQPQSISASKSQTGQSIKDEAWAIVKKYPLGFREYINENAGSLDDVSYCRMVIRDKKFIIRNDPSSLKNQDYEYTGKSQTPSTHTGSKAESSPESIKEDIDFMCMIYNLPQKKVEKLYNKDKISFKSLVYQYRGIIDHTSPEILAEIALHGYYKPSHNYEFSLSLKGRIGRMEYFLSQMGVMIGSCMILYVPNWVIVLILYMLITWFQIAQGTKRCHDLGKSGWYQCIPFYFIWLFFAGKKDKLNRYGFRLG